MTRIAIAQMNLHLGAIEKNTDRIMEWTQRAIEQNADLILFPELAITSYPPEDLLFRPQLYERIEKALSRLCEKAFPITLVVGHPQKIQHAIFNAASVIQNGKHIATYHKQALPNYEVFDEKRYFTPGNLPCVFELHQKKWAVTICEDCWIREPAKQAKAIHAECILCINASPFDRFKSKTRQQHLKQRAVENHLPIIYANLVGGQDEMVFDGGSFVMDDQGKVIQQAPYFEEILLISEMNSDAKPIPQPLPPKMTEIEKIYHALVLGTRDYIKKNAFTNAVIGLSGGIDSALTLSIASDAIGAEHVTAVMMPSRYTASISLEDAKAEAETLQVHYKTISIEPIFGVFLNSLQPFFADLPSDTTEENIQARIRGTLLMALSNKFHSIVLTTGNRSEMAVGYATLYGDMAGGFAVLKNIPKTLVYQLAHYRNQIFPVIPQRVINRAPSAELSENQKDEDSLPPYNILDQILEYYIENDMDAEAIIKKGFNKKLVHKIIRMVDRNEYKRRQAPPGIRITHRAFGKDRRYPITSGYLF